jgi:hypothetical protein
MTGFWALTTPCESMLLIFGLRSGESKSDSRPLFGRFLPGICPFFDLSDHAKERRWRHLDMMRFLTEFVARLPRCRYPDHGVKTIVLPWSGKHSRFTLFFEAFAIEVV